MPGRDGIEPPARSPALIAGRTPRRALPAVLQPPGPADGPIRRASLRWIGGAGFSVLGSALHPPRVGFSGRRVVVVVDVIDDRSHHDDQEHGDSQVFHRAILSMLPVAPCARVPLQRHESASDLYLEGYGTVWKACYFPMQKLLNIRASKSSLVNSPVISASAFCASRSSSATSSPARITSS